MRSPKRSPSPATVDWPAHVEALSRSGLSVSAYAREHGLKPDTLYRWRRRFPPSAQEPAAATPRLVPITVEVEPACEVVFPDGRRLRFPATLPAATLRAWVGALGAS